MDTIRCLLHEAGEIMIAEDREVKKGILYWTGFATILMCVMLPITLYICFLLFLEDGINKRPEKQEKKTLGYSLNQNPRILNIQNKQEGLLWNGQIQII